MANLFPLPIKVEILINGTWQDISLYVYQRDDISITGGQTASGDTVQPASCTMTLDNRDGRFSPRFVQGAYFPNLQRNVQIRVSLVGATSSSGNTYTGFRFWGEVAEWPPFNDPTGNDVYVQITASGPLRRVNMGGGQGSALSRYYAQLTGLFAPVAYWPCEEGPGTTTLGPSVDGGQVMNITAGTPVFKAISNFNGSAPIGIVNGSTWDGLTSSFNTSGDDVFSTPGVYNWTSPVASVDARVWGAGAGGDNGGTGAAGGAGEFAREATLAVTIGKSYVVTVGAPGAGGALTFSSIVAGTDGGLSSIVGDSVTVTGHPGRASTSADVGGTGSTNTTHHNGGTGGQGRSSGLAGSAGASSAGTALAGVNGTTATTNTAPLGATAPSGGGNGGAGGNGGPGVDKAGNPGQFPGGGGGGGGFNSNNGACHSGAIGGGGKVELIYTPASVPSAVVVRFICFVPLHGGNAGHVLLRAIGSGTINHMDIIYSARRGSLQLKGFATGGATLFDSGSQAFNIDGQTVMISAELAQVGTGVQWTLTAIIAGATAPIATFTGTLATTTLGNVTEMIVAPNADITKTAIGHVSLQYALIPLKTVSNAINGQNTEVSVDRFIRLANEQALANQPQFVETVDHFGFETGTQSWAIGNSTVAQSAVTATGWPTEGTHSLLVTSAGAAGAWEAASPIGTAGFAIQPGDTASFAIDVYTPAALGAINGIIFWYNAAGTFLSNSSGPTRATAAGDVFTVTFSAIAPTSTAFFAIGIVDSETVAAGKLMYLDNARISPSMGPQTAKEYKTFLAEIAAADQGILMEAKTAFGLGYNTRLSLINQSPGVTLDYAQSMISPPLAPVVDSQNVKNDVTVTRVKGSSVHITQNNGQMSVSEPPAGVGKFKKTLQAVVAADTQLLALASHLLLLGTITDERFPTISANLGRTGIAGHPLAPNLSAVANIQVGDFVELINLPFWFPSTTVKQIVIGYAETINAFDWEITWNCVPESPYEITATNLRRW